MPNDNLQERLDSAYKALLRAEQLATAGRFAGQIMHEINNPLEALGNLIYLANIDRDDPEKVAVYLGQAEDQLRHVQEIARRTLAFYRAPEAPQQVDLIFVLESALRMHTPNLTKKGIEIRRSFPDAARLLGNHGELLQIFSNLITNAVAALPSRGQLHVRITRCAHQVHALIADNGSGIPEGLRAQLFRPFTTKDKTEGTGLGLWITKTLVEKHQGTIRCRSTTRKGRSGTAFRITLPA